MLNDLFLNVNWRTSRLLNVATNYQTSNVNEIELLFLRDKSVVADFVCHNIEWALPVMLYLHNVLIDCSCTLYGSLSCGTQFESQEIFCRSIKNMVLVEQTFIFDNIAAIKLLDGKGYKILVRYIY